MRPNLIRAVVAIAVCLALGPVILGQDVYTHPRIISVTGTAEIKVAPDEVTLILGMDSHDKDLSVAKATNDRSTKKLLSLVRDAGVDAKNIQTSALSMGPEYSEEKIPKLFGYRVSQTVVLTLKDISKYEGLLTDALKAGVNRVDGINFAISDPKKYNDEARLKAIKAAREKATAMATELGQSVGKPWEVTETEYDTTALSANFGANFYKNAFMSKVAVQTESPIAGGEVTINALVRVSFQLE